MAFSTDVEICNLALNQIGEPSITAAQLAAPGNNKAALACSALFEPTRDTVLEYPWNFAMQRIEYDVDDFTDTITATTAANPIVVTGTDISAANIVDDIGVYIWDTGINDINGEVFIAKNTSGETFELYKRDNATSYNGTSLGTTTSGYVRIAPLNEYAYMFKLPTDLLRIWKVKGDDASKYEREGDYILTDDDNIGFQYIKHVTTVANFHPSFIFALSTLLASRLALRIADKPELSKALYTEYLGVTLPNALRNGALESLPKDNQERRNPNNLTPWQKANFR